MPLDTTPTEGAPSAVDTASPAASVSAPASTPAPSSPASTSTDAAPAPAPAPASSVQDTGPNDPLPAPSKDAEPTSLFDAALRAVVKEKTADPAAATTNGTAAATAPAAAGTAAAGEAAPAVGDQGTAGAAADEPDLTEADLADIQKPGIRKRISKLIAQRNEVREQLAGIQPEADAWRQHREFLVANNVSPQDSQLLYGVAAAIARGDYATFLTAVRPYVEAAETALGVRLPADLQRQVDDGLVPTDTARELARARAAADTATVQAMRAEQTVASVTQAQHTAQLRGAVSEWEANVRRSDPDFALKQDAMSAHAQAIVASRGLPRTRAEAVAMAQEAYDAVNRFAARFRPAPAATAPAPTSVHVATQGTPEPRNLLEAIQLGLRQARPSG